MNDNVTWHASTTSRRDRSLITGGKGLTVWLTGLSGSGKSTIAMELESKLIDRGRAAYVLDGDNLRHGINSDLGFSPADRGENVRRVSEIARLMADAGLVVLVPIISPYANGRGQARAAHEAAGIGFIEVFVDTPLEVCEERDPKGLYARARAGEIKDMTGIDAPYEAPENPVLVIDGAATAAEAAASLVLSQIEKS